MTKQKTVPELKAELAANERQLTQLRHKQQQLENRAAYYEKGDRRKRAPLWKKPSPCRRSRACSWRPSTSTTKMSLGVIDYRTVSFSCDPD